MIMFISILVFMHWCCDFVLQNGDINTQNEKLYKLHHVFYYTATFSLLTLCLSLFWDATIVNTLYFILFAVFTHGVVDYLLIPVLYIYKRKHDLKHIATYWALDQVVHIICILVAFNVFISPVLL